MELCVTHPDPVWNVSLSPTTRMNILTRMHARTPLQRVCLHEQFELSLHYSLQEGNRKYKMRKGREAAKNFLYDIVNNVDSGFDEDKLDYCKSIVCVPAVGESCDDDEDDLDVQQEDDRQILCFLHHNCENFPRTRSYSACHHNR